MPHVLDSRIMRPFIALVLALRCVDTLTLAVFFLAATDFSGSCVSYLLKASEVTMRFCLNEPYGFKAEVHPTPLLDII